MNIKMKSKFTFPFSPLPFHLAIIIIPILFLLLSCSPNTEISKGSLSGTITLDGMQDHSGISVSLYDLAILDTTIVRINNEYPQIGVKITQHTEFDHRFQSPIFTTETNDEGFFKIKNIPTGIYNLVAEKAGYGFSYALEIGINEGENLLANKRKMNEENSLSNFTLTRISDLILYPEHHISGIIDYDVIVAPFHHLVIDSDTEFVPGTNFTIMPNAVVRINPGQDLIIHGNLTAQGEEDNMFWVTSNDGFADDSKFKMENLKWKMNKEDSENFTYTKRDSLALYSSMQLSSVASVSDDLIEWGKWSWGNTIDCTIDIVDVKNIVLKKHSSGFVIEGDDWNISNSLFDNIIANKALNFNNSNDILTERNIFYKCKYGTEYNNVVNGDIMNNYYAFGEYGVQIYNYSENIKVRHNDFFLIQKYAIKVYYYTNPQIEHNNITGKYGVLNTEMTGCWSIPEIHYNNINCSTIAIKTIGNCQIYDIPAENNYYYTINETEISGALIWDYEDAPVAMQQNGLGHILFQPILSIKVNDAGISVER